MSTRLELLEGGTQIMDTFCTALVTIVKFLTMLLRSMRVGTNAASF